MQGYRVYLGLLLSALGSFGLFEAIGFTQEEVAKAVDVLVALVGFAVALWFNYTNHRDGIKK